MVYLFYVFSNWWVSIAAIITLLHYHGRQILGNELYRKLLQGQGSSKSHDITTPSSSRDLLISRHFQILMMLGSIVRVYWSNSPPSVWSGTSDMCVLLSILDVFISPMLWIAVVCYCPPCEEEENVLASKNSKNAFWFSWQMWTGVCVVLSLVFEMFRTGGSLNQGAWFCDGAALIFTMLIEGCAVLPQLYLISNVKFEEGVGAEKHIMGLVCLGHVFRYCVKFMFFGRCFFFSNCWYYN